MILLICLVVKISIISVIAVLLSNTAYTVYYKGIHINESCGFDPCLNGNCSIQLTGYRCVCDTGWTGINCSYNSSNLQENTNHSQSDINVCDVLSCDHGTCSNTVDGYLCECYPGWIGENCSQYISLCEPSPCNQGNCSSINDTFICTCHSGWTGFNCSNEIDECQNIPCIHGNCTDLVGDYLCHCEQGWTGRNCSEDINECEDDPCHHGNCSNLHNAYHCHCVIGWLGTNCSQAVSNVALDKVTSMSSVYEGNSALYGAHKGVDGDTNQQMYPVFSCFRNSESEVGLPWWRVDLGGLFWVQSVKLYNRMDCCSSRAKDIEVIMGTSLTNMSPVGFVSGQIADIEELVLSNVTEARFVQVTMNGTEPFHLCEVEVFGIPD